MQRDKNIMIITRTCSYRVHTSQSERCAHTYIHAYMHMHIHIRIHVNAHICLHIRIHMYIHIHVHIHILIHTHTHTHSHIYMQLDENIFSHGWAPISRILNIIGLFLQKRLWKRRYSATETYNFKEATNRSHPIHNKQSVSCACVCTYIYTSIHTNTHAPCMCVWMYMYVYVYVYMVLYVCMHVQIYMSNINLCTHRLLIIFKKFLSSCICTCAWMYMYVYVYAYMGLYICTSVQSPEIAHHAARREHFDLHNEHKEVCAQIFICTCEQTYITI